MYAYKSTMRFRSRPGDVNLFLLHLVQLFYSYSRSIRCVLFEIVSLINKEISLVLRIVALLTVFPILVILILNSRWGITY